MEILQKIGEVFIINIENSEGQETSVYHITETECKVVHTLIDYFSEDKEDIDTYVNVIILKTPLEKGNKWESQGLDFEIVDTEAEVRT